MNFTHVGNTSAIISASGVTHSMTFSAPLRIQDQVVKRIELSVVSFALAKIKFIHDFVVFTTGLKRKH